MNKNIERNIRIYYIYKILLLAGMRGPILIIYMTKFCGMPLQEVFFCEACCVILSVLLQIPTGAIADKWGRANTIKVGCFLLIGELICFATATDRILLWIGNFIWAVGSSLINGADSALIYDTLKTNIKNTETLSIRNMEVDGKSTSYALMISAFLSLITSYVVEINIRLPILFDLLATTLAFIISFFFVETKLHSQEKEARGYGNHIVESVKYVLTKSNLLWIIAFSTLLGVTSKLWFFIYNPYFQIVELPIRYYGCVFFALNMVAGISSYYANYLVKKMDEKTSVIFSISTITVPVIIMGLIISKLSISLILFQGMVRGYVGPFMNNMLHKRINSKNRATILSVKSAINQAVEVVCMFSFGLVISTINLRWAITFLGIVSTAVGIILIIIYVKLFHKSDEVRAVT